MVLMIKRENIFLKLILRQRYFICVVEKLHVLIKLHISFSVKIDLKE